MIQNFRLPAYAVAFETFFAEVQERLLRANSPVLDIFFSGPESPVKAATATTETGSMHIEEAEAEWSLCWSPGDYLNGNFDHIVAEIADQCNSVAASLVPKALGSLVSQGELRSVDISSFSDDELWDLYIDGIEHQSVSRGADGSPQIDPVLMSPSVGSRLSNISRKPEQDKRYREIVNRKLSEFAENKSRAVNDSQRSIEVRDGPAKRQTSSSDLRNRYLLPAYEASAIQVVFEIQTLCLLRDPVMCLFASMHQQYSLGHGAETIQGKFLDMHRLRSTIPVSLDIEPQDEIEGNYQNLGLACARSVERLLPEAVPLAIETINAVGRSMGGAKATTSFDWDDYLSMAEQGTTLPVVVIGRDTKLPEMTSEQVQLLQQIHKRNAQREGTSN